MREFNVKVELYRDIFDECKNEYDETDYAKAALIAHKKYALNNADCRGGINSDQAAWRVAQFGEGRRQN